MVRLITKYKAGYSELRGAKILKETKAGYWVKYLDQKVWVARCYIKLKKERIFVVDWFIERHFA